MMLYIIFYIILIMKNITLQAEKYISFKHIHIDLKSNRAVYLGYPLEVTKTEFLILCAFIEGPKKPLSAEDIAAAASLDLSKENVAYHISRINAKAKRIGNRILIKNLSKTGYFLNEEM